MTPERGHFINVDLEVRSARRLGPLVKAFVAAGFHVLADMKWHEGGYYASFEFDFAGGRILRAADTKVRLMTKAIEALSPDVRAMWDGATTRVFDVGIQGGYAQRLALQVPLSRLAMNRIAAVNGEINITVYSAGRPTYTPDELATHLQLQRKLTLHAKRGARARPKRSTNKPK